MKIPAGMIVKQIIDEKKLKAAEVGDKMGMSRQSVYQSYAKMSFSDQDVKKWAAALGVTPDEFNERWKSGTTDNTKSGSSDYLLEHLTSLENQFVALTEQSKALFEQFQSQLAVKDRQIERLMDLLGKLRPASEESKVFTHPAVLADAA